MLTYKPENFLKIHCCCHEKNIFPWRQSEAGSVAWRFYWTMSSGAEMEVNGKKIPLRTDCFYLLPGGLHFSTSATKPFEQFYIHFSLCEKQPALQDFFILPADEETKSLILRTISRQNANRFRQLYELSAISIVTSALLRLPPKALTLPEDYDPRIAKTLEWIHNHLDHVSDNDFLSRIAGMSRNGFLRLFEAQLQDSPQRYYRKKRIEKACELLRYSELTIEEIAEKTGFSDRYHFSRVFWQMMRFTPASFRKRLREHIPAKRELDLSRNRKN